MTRHNLYFTLLILVIIINSISCHSRKYNVVSQDSSKEVAIKKSKLSIVQKLKENARLSIAERIELYKRLKKENPYDYNFENETELTLYGYSFLWANNISEAIEIFKLIVEQFPNSSNAYDSLGEAYFKNNSKQLALANYVKSLELNPDNFNAEDVIEQIQNPNGKPLTAHEKFKKMYSKKEYIEDLEQMGKRLYKVHPTPWRFITTENFLKNIDSIKTLITDNTTYGEFAWHCNSIIASIGCSHTTSSNMQNLYHEYSMLPLENTFPLKIRLIDDQLFVTDAMNNSDKVNVKDEILSINGIEKSEIISDIYRHIPAQANIKTYKQQHFNTYFAVLIAYSLNLPGNFEIVTRGNNEPVKLHKADSFATELYDSSINTCNQDLCLEISARNTALLTISSFNYYEWENFPVFKAFIDSSMNVIHKKGIKNLIIDVRYNRGGSQYPSIYLLQHLVNRSFTYYSKAEFEGKIEKLYGEESVEPHENRFSGKVYFLIDGNGNSTTGHFMSLVKALNLGTIIGEELGSNSSCTAGQTLCRLKNTKLVYSVANNIHVSTATQLPYNIGILPDHFVTQNIDEYLQRIDVVKKFALNLIDK